MEDLEFYEQKINALIDVERLDDARRELSNAYKLFPEATSLKYIDAKISFMADSLEAAHESILAALEEDPEDPNYIFLHCKILSGMNRYKEAISVIEELIGDYPEDAENYAYYASILYQMDDYKKARQLVLKALEIDPDEVLAKTILPLIDIAEGNTNATDKIVQELLEEHPESEGVAWLLGLQLYSKHRYKEAMHVFQELLCKNPKDPDTIEMIIELKVLLHPLCKTFSLLIYSDWRLTLFASCILSFLTKWIFKMGYHNAGITFGIASCIWLSASWILPAILRRKYNYGFSS